MVVRRPRSKLVTTLVVAGIVLVTGVLLVIVGLLRRTPDVREAQTPVAVPQAPAAAEAPAAPQAPATPIALSATNFRYRGKWQIVTGMEDGRFDGMSARSLVPGARMIIRYAGRGIRVYGVDGPQGGSATVAIDGSVLDTDVSFHASSKKTHVLVFASDALPRGHHRVWVTVNPRSSDHPRRGYVNVESAAYDP